MTALILPISKDDSAAQTKNKTSFQTKLCLYLLILVAIGVAIVLLSIPKESTERNDTLEGFFANTSYSEACFDCLCDARTYCDLEYGCFTGEDFCGPFLMLFSYYKNCGMPGHKEGDDPQKSFRECADDYECSKLCIKQHSLKYDFNCTHIPDFCERMVQLSENGGCPAWKKEPLEWSSVRECLAKKQLSY